MEKQKKSSGGCCSGGGQNSGEYQGNGLKLAQQQQPQKECKIVFLGDKAVGKSSIALRFYKDEFSSSYNLTIGGAYIQTQITLKNQQTLKIHLWDTGGDERFRSMANLYYREAKAAILVYDVSDLSTFNGVDYWIKELEEAVEKDKMILALAGNKCDLPPSARQVSVEKAKSYAQEHNLIFLETSAKSGAGIQELFSRISEEIYRNLQSS